MDNNNKTVLVKVRNLKKWFPIKKGIFLVTVGHVKAVDNISFDIYKGETLGVVGESGCGKSTLARTVIRLIEPTEGSIEYNGIDLLTIKNSKLKKMRKNMQIIFQDPFGSLHPKMKIKTILEESLIISKYGNKEKRLERVKELMHMVGLNKDHINRFPHEFSGGQRQRIVIARALATNPELIICDEPVSALDVSVRSQILNLLEELQDKMKLTYLFISHDLSVVEHICNRIIVMYLGQIVEIGKRDDIFKNPRHPYTKALLSAIPLVKGSFSEEKIILEGDIPSPANPPAGCRFHTRCRYAVDKCKKQVPKVCTINEDGHQVACHRYNEIQNKIQGV